MTDTPAPAAPWTVKSVPVEVRQKAVRAANAAGQTMGEWLTDMVNRVTNPHFAPAIMPPARSEMVPPEIDLPGLAASIQAAVMATQAAGGAVPKALGRDAAATLRCYMRAARGLPERQTTRQTLSGNGQTTLQIEGDHPPMA